MHFKIRKIPYIFRSIERVWNVKKVLWILGTVIACVFYAFLVGILLTVGNIVVSMVTRSEIQSLNQDLFNVVMLSGWAVLTILSIWQWKRWNLKCPACRRWGALQLVQTDILKKENISVLMELEHRNLNRQVIGTHDQYVAGKRTRYQDTYKCKHCGNLGKRTRTEDRASI